MDMREVNHQVRIQEWRQIISECRNSGKPVREWCAENSIKASRYYYWLRVIRNESLVLMQRDSQIAQSSFAAVMVKETEALSVKSNDTCAVVKGRNFSVEIKNGANIETLENTLRVLNNLC
ncbi:IS66 family insertion sequence element accessory protein TnpA [Sporosalibacterium faouarense]|uniref:IS66 family insertion sequence element accessory protein TnpA n=1 Tax=Sporosalibacterium faouarense TaxID=516123 RepID=UPI00192AF4B4|nr:IS66 family insertion sequence element accessory protein TnpB [Sporosalibacterium faouarense]